ncbi:MAG: hypothetical protein H6867_00590 [Rhodospirillales bacterium]|nr:hypothetical protein [Rhodospirillales bacterium]MCB9996844.1 hypothetical protein [Rhodospirillales bacterium]
MANNVDQAIGTIGGQPIFSGLCALFGAAACVDFTMGSHFADMTLVTAAASIPAVVALTAIGGINAFRDRSKLSKSFSTAAAGTGIASMLAFAAQLSQPEMAGLLAPVFSVLGMTVSGGLNLAGHYTRNTHLNVNVSVDKQGPKPPEPPR